MVELQEIVQLGKNVQSAILAWGLSLSAVHSTSVPRVVDHLVLEGRFVCCERECDKEGEPGRNTDCKTIEQA